MSAPDWLDPEKLLRVCKYQAKQHCPAHLQEDAASAAVVRILEIKDKYDPAKANINTFLYNYARFGVLEFLRKHTGKNPTYGQAHQFEYNDDIYCIDGCCLKTQR